MLALGLLFVAGCGIGSERISPFEIRARELEREKAQVAGQLEQCQVELAQVKAQVQALSALPQGEKRDLFALRAVKISRFTGFYDKDEDGRREKLIVYLQPLDRTGDAVKAVGSVSVQLWNLESPDGQALLGQWQVQAQEMSQLWFNTLTSPGYRLTFDAPTTPQILAQPMTVRITFTDYLAGGVFTDQYVIKPRSGAPKE
ncbi:MAG: hypothetical protein FJ280_03725 [Planctomycetes bacterium]|nr:hypothetical protein [Planctomycetota bacterium]